MIWLHIKSIFSFRFYHRLAFATRGQMIAFGIYLFMLSLVVFYFFAGSYIDKNLPVLLKNFPEVTFEKGVLTAPKNAVSVTVPDSNVKLVFDASRTTPPTQDDMVKEQILMLVSGNKLYMPAANGVQSRELPPQLTFVTSQDNLAKQKDSLASALMVMACLSALVAIPFVMLFGFCVAGAVGMFFKLLTRSALPRRIIFKWAFFMLGPLSALWYARLYWNIPLFTFAQIILCLIYMQQIFNTLPEEK